MEQCIYSGMPSCNGNFNNSSLQAASERESFPHHSHPSQSAPNQMGEGGRGGVIEVRETGPEEGSRRGGRRDEGGSKDVGGKSTGVRKTEDFLGFI